MLKLDLESKGKLKGTVAVPVGLFIVLVPFSLLIGWNLLTGILFWLIILPGLSIYLPKIFSNNKNHLFESLVGMTFFYAFIIFMIYDHFKTNFFQLMLLSLILNLMLISAISWKKVPRVQILLKLKVHFNLLHPKKIK